MTNKETIELMISELKKDINIKSIRITGWVECGEFSGEDPRPLLEITMHKPANQFERPDKEQ